MPGTKGKSGGARPKVREDDGRGRPVEKRRLKVGDQFAVAWHSGDGRTAIQLWTVKELSRTVIVFDDGAGGEYRLVN
jgi:hypothetical protein